jgi:hypothetical protein
MLKGTLFIACIISHPQMTSNHHLLHQLYRNISEWLTQGGWNFHVHLYSVTASNIDSTPATRHGVRWCRHATRHTRKEACENVTALQACKQAKEQSHPTSRMQGCTCKGCLASKLARFKCCYFAHAKRHVAQDAVVMQQYDFKGEIAGQ